jgi:PAS domain S-box-containing protein
MTKKRQCSPCLLVLVFIVLSACVITAGYLYYSNYKTQYETEIGKQLTAIGKLKADELSHWRKERLGDASTFYKNKAFSKLVSKYFNDPDDADALGQLQAWLSRFRTAYKYSSLVLFDAQGVERISVPEISKVEASHMSEHAVETLNSNEITFLDFHRHSPDGPVFLHTLVPILDATDNSRLIGELFIDINPDDYLYPYIANWPLASVTGETLLVRRKGGSVEFLNDLKFQKGAALTLKSSLANEDLPATKAVLGHEGIVKGVDYRGVPVIADVRAVPDSPWFLVTRMDISEVNAPLKYRLLVVIAFATILIGGIGTSLGLFWRRLLVRFYKEQYESVQKWSETFDSLPDWVSIVDRDSRFRLVNKTFAQVFEKQPEEFIGKRCCKLVHNTQKPLENCPLEKTLSTGKPAKIEIYYDPLKKHLEVSTFPIFDDKGKVVEAVHIMRDITIRKLLEETRKKTDTMLQNALKFNSDIISNAAVGVIVYDRELRYLEWNTFMENLTGMEKKDVIGKKAVEIFPHLQEQGIDKLLLRALAGETVSSPDIMYLCAQAGKTSWISGTYTSYRNSIGQIIGVIGVIRDITERKKAEEALRGSEYKFRTLFASSRDGIATADLNGHITECNQAYADMLGYTPEELRRTTFLKLTPEKWHQKNEEMVKNVLVKGYSKEFEKEYIRKDGTIFPVSLRTWRISDDKGKVTGICSIVRDITESKRVENFLRDSEERFRELFTHMSGAVAIYEPENNGEDFIFKDCNQALLSIEKIDKGRVIGRRVTEVFPGVKEFGIFEVFKRVYRTGKAERFPVSFYQDERISGWRDNYVYKLPSGEIVAIYDDITERKLAEESLKQSRDELERVNGQLVRSTEHANQMAKEAIEAYEAKGQFLANMSHEIRTPMNAIIGFSDILAEEKLPKNQKEYVELIQQSSRYLLNLINDVLDFSKADIGKIELNETVFFVSKIVNLIEAQMRPEAEKKGLKFEVVQSGDLPAQMKGDPARLLQCLNNLISNAVKFTEKGHIRIKVRPENKDGKSFVRFDIEDTGIGIAADQSERIFESFVQLDGTSSRKYGGTGLGLTITKQLTKLIGGQLTVTSEPGKGSVFSFIVPTNIDISSQTYVEMTHSTEQECKYKATEPAKFSGRALVAEDVVTNQKLMRHLLEKMGLEVTIVDDGKKAIQEAVSQPFDIIFMDMQMPNMDGYEATKEIRKKGIKVPVVALTAYAMPGDDRRCIKAGCDDYLSKPLIYSRLVKTIAKYLSEAVSSESADFTEKSDNSKNNKRGTNMVENTDEVVIDWAKITAGGLDEQIVKEVMPTYLAESRKHLQELTSAVGASNAKDVKLHAHAMKGAGRNLGIARLSDVAGQLESIAADGDLSKAQELLKKVADEFEKFEKFVSRPDWIEAAKEKAALEMKT